MFYFPFETGVTSITPAELDFPSTMTDMTHDTWMLRYRIKLLRSTWKLVQEMDIILNSNIIGSHGNAMRIVIATCRAII